MISLGANAGRTRQGRKLKDGGACLIDDSGIVAAVAEERLSRVKHDGGFTYSVPHVLRGATSSAQPRADVTTLTSCCEELRSPESYWRLVPESHTIRTILHHDAHAYSAFWPSPFEHALVVVLDSGGNTLSEVSDDRWWASRREQASYYVGYGDNLELVARDFSEPLEAGFGEMYRAFTHYLGWQSSTLAGNTMALAALGDDKYADRSVFEFAGGRIRTCVMADPENPIDMVECALQRVGIRSPGPRLPGGPFLVAHVEIAQLLQRSFYEAVKERIAGLTAVVGSRHVCFAGGVSLNCVAIGRLVSEGVVDDVFVQPAAGDTGQSLGAALSGWHFLGGDRESGVKRYSPYLGRPAPPSALNHALDWIRAQGVNVDVFSNVSPEEVARLIAAGLILGWFEGSSEFGPRALGARSILADPRYQTSRKRLIELKNREWFMPFAPSVVSSAAARYFEGAGSTTMTVAVKGTPRAHADIGATLHVDGTARVQLVSDGSAGLFVKVLDAFGRRTGVPVLLNTSFNLCGEPMVESPFDAARTFARSNLDGLYLDGFLILRR